MTVDKKRKTVEETAENQKIIAIERKRLKAEKIVKAILKIRETKLRQWIETEEIEIKGL